MSEPDFERIKAVKKAAQGRLLGIPGVHAVGIGAKTTGGVRTTEPSIMVFLVAKKPPGAIPPGEMIPAEIDGVPTDVVEMDVPRLQADHDTSRPRPLKAGVTIQAGGALEYGTLGYIAHLDEPQPRTVAVTCQHVVAPPMGSAVSDLTALTPPNPPPNPYQITFLGSNTRGSLVVVKMLDNASGQAYNAWYRTLDADTPASVATNVAAGVNSIAGLSATAVAAADKVTITSPGAAVTVRACSVYDANAPDAGVQLSAAAAGNALTFSGSSDGTYGLYTTWNVDGDHPTFGVFAEATPAMPLATIASRVAGAINVRPPAGIHAAAAGATVTVTGASEIQCKIARDVQVGQPTDSFGSRCSHCCSDRIGRVIDSRIDLDVALVRLDTGLQYLAEIRDVGTVTGSHHVTLPEIHGAQPYAVRKCGARTGVTHGTIASLNVGGYSTNSHDVWTVFFRFYDDAMIVTGDGGDPFSDQGDSGSAVLNDAREVVGILFGGTSARSQVTPMDVIELAFDVIAETATVPNAVNTVPAAPGDHFAMAPALPEQVQQMEREIVAVAAGERYAALIRRHFAEAHALVNANRRVAAAWHRAGGPRIMQRLLDMSQHRDAALPQEIDGRPLADCLARLGSAFERYGSPQLGADVRRYGAALGTLAGLTYPQIVQTLHTWTVD